MTRQQFSAVICLGGLLALLGHGNWLLAQDKGAPVTDARLAKPKDYNGYFPWTPPTDLKGWEVRRQLVREQVLVANGLWPMPEKMPLQPVIHGKIERDGYTIEKVLLRQLCRAIT